MARLGRDCIASRGLLLAPLAALPASALHLAAWHQNAGAAVGAVYAALVVLPLSYSLSFLLGVPCLHLLGRLHLLNAAMLSICGLLVGAATGLVVALLLFPPWDWYGRLFYISLGAVCGLSVGLVYWAVAATERRLK